MILELYKASLNDGGRKVFSGLSFLVNPGERIAVVGGSCGDRTQLLQVLLGLRRLDSGWACLDGSPVLPRLGTFYRSCMSYMPSSFSLGNITVEQLARYVYSEQANKAHKYDAEQVKESLGALGIDSNCLALSFDKLDPSTTQRVLMALTFMFNRPVALFDNPTSEQDEEGRVRVIDYIRSPRFKDVAMLLATEDPAIVEVCDKVVRI